LKICLPAEVAARYLASDGYVAKKFQRALNFFSQPDHFIQASEIEFPVGYEDWPQEVVGGYVGSGEESAQVLLRVPLQSTGEMRVVLHAISAVADGKFELARWQPGRPMAYDDGYDSPEEEEDPRFRSGVMRLRRIVDKELPVIEQPRVETRGWFYDSTKVVRDRRSGVVDFPARIREGLKDLDVMASNYVVPVSTGIDIVEGQGVGVVKFGSVESPGGSEVCELPLAICQRMNVGKKLKAEDFMIVAAAARREPERFVASKLFDCFSGPWDSVLDSLMDPEVVGKVVLSGMASDVFGLVNLLRRRHGIEVNSVLAKSHVFTKSYLRVFKGYKPSVDSLFRAIKAGTFDRVAQTEGFISRVKDLKTSIDKVLLFAETNGVYLPSYITDAQRGLPLRGVAPLGVLGGNLTRMPGEVARTLASRNHHIGLSGRLYDRMSGKKSGVTTLGGDGESGVFPF